jgi:rhodanese-related sulfurtransferase
VTDPFGTLEPLRMLAAGLLGGLLLLTFGGLAFLISAFSSERGRALAWAVGIVIVMYTASFLLPLWSPTSELVKLTPFGWFDPAPLIQRGEDFLLLDVRQPAEYEIASLPGAVLIPLGELSGRLSELEPYRDKRIVVHCHHGGRSMNAVRGLRQLGFSGAQNLAGGIDLWSQSVDPQVPRY